MGMETMKKILIAALTFLGSFLLTAGNVHYAPVKNDRWIQFSAKDLARCLTAVSGKKYDAVTEGKKSAGDIVLGTDPKLADQEWRIENRNGILYIEGCGTPGIVYGVYNFLEKYASCAWLDPDTEILPSQPGWKLPQVNETGKPAFWRREVYIADVLDSLWRLRNRENVRAIINFNYIIKC